MVTPDELTKKGGERQPGLEQQVHVKPEYIRANYHGSNKLKGKYAVISGGDSGIGRSAAVHFAREGAEGIAILYLDEDQDAEETKEILKREGVTKLLVFRGDVGDPQFCRDAIGECQVNFGRIDVLVNNAGEQHLKESLLDITPDQLERTFRTNIFSMFYLTQAALPHMPEGSSIINTSSVTAYKGMASLLDYSSTKGAIVSFTRSLSKQLASKNIRVNATAPGPIWTKPLIPSTFPEEKLEDFGKGVGAGLGRAAHPSEVGPTYVFLASEDSTFYTGQVLHPNGGDIING